MPWDTLVLLFFFRFFEPPFLVFAETAFFPDLGRKVSSKLFELGFVLFLSAPIDVVEGGRISDLLNPYPRGLSSNNSSKARAAATTGAWFSLITLAMTIQKFLPNRSKQLGLK